MEDEQVSQGSGDGKGEEVNDDDDSIEFLEWPHSSKVRCVCANPSFADMTFDQFWAEIHTEYRFDPELDEDVMREYHSRLWEHEGISANWHEDSLAYPNRKPGRAGIRYESCTPAELKRMVKERGLRDPYEPGVTLKPLYLRILDEDDRKQKFRFMDLPAELRINVCRLLLTKANDRSPRYWDVAILRTCRQVYEEAKDLVYTENVINVGFGITDIQEDESIVKRVHVHNDTEEFTAAHGRHFCMPGAIDDYPDFLRRVQRLELRLSYEFEFRDANSADLTIVWFPLNQLLFGFTSFLMEGHDLKHLEIRFNFLEHMEDSEYEQCLYPLLRLPNIPNIACEGYIPGHVGTKLKREMASAEPGFNTLRQWRLLTKEASAQLALFEMLGCMGCNCGECNSPTERVEQLLFRLQSLTEAKEDGFISSAHEEQFLARLGMLKRTLQAVNISELKSKVQTLTDGRKAVQLYDKTTDDARLEEAIEIWDSEIYEDPETIERPSHDWSDEVDDRAVDDQKLLDSEDIARVFKQWGAGSTPEADDDASAARQTARPLSAASSRFTIPDEDF